LLLFIKEKKDKKIAFSFFACLSFSLTPEKRGFCLPQKIPASSPLFLCHTMSEREASAGNQPQISSGALPDRPDFGIS